MDTKTKAIGSAAIGAGLLYATGPGSILRSNGSSNGSSENSDTKKRSKAQKEKGKTLKQVNTGITGFADNIRENPSPVIRVIAGAGAGLLTLYGLQKKGLLGSAAMAVGSTVLLGGTLSDKIDELFSKK